MRLRLPRSSPREWDAPPAPSSSCCLPTCKTPPLLDERVLPHLVAPCTKAATEEPPSVTPNMRSTGTSLRSRPAG